MPAAFPTATEARAYLNSLGLVTTAQVTAMDVESRVLAARAAFEESTGWYPFLAGGSDTSRQYDPPGPNDRAAVSGVLKGGARILELEAGLTQAPTTLVTSYSPTFAGNALTHQTDFWMLPANADLRSKPFTAIEFVVPQWGSPRSIRITGRFGYQTTVPDLAWNAVLQQVAFLCAPELAGKVSAGILSYTEGGITERYSDDALGGYVKQWQETWRRAVGTYRRVVL